MCETRKASTTSLLDSQCLKISEKSLIFDNIASKASYDYLSQFSCLFTFLVQMSAVCLYYGTIVSCLFTLWYHCQLFVYIYSTNVSCLFTFNIDGMSEFGILNKARFARNVVK